ncbi:hypothetical protein IG631_13595 [Alternaria alternata]|nr:hypothetical protein IG631_13595 [Alternaria alternata]
MTTPSRDDDLTYVRKLRIYLCILCTSSAQYCTAGSSCTAESSFLLPGRVQGRPDPPAWRHVCRTRRQGFVKRINSLSLKQPEKPTMDERNFAGWVASAARMHIPW